MIFVSLHKSKDKAVKNPSNKIEIFVKTNEWCKFIYVNFQKKKTAPTREREKVFFLIRYKLLISPPLATRHVHISFKYGNSKSMFFNKKKKWCKTFPVKYFLRFLFCFIPPTRIISKLLFHYLILWLWQNKNQQELYVDFRDKSKNICDRWTIRQK